MKLKITLTQEARDILQLIWLSEMNSWKPERPHPESDSGVCAESQIIELENEPLYDLGKVMQNKLFANVVIMP